MDKYIWQEDVKINAFVATILKYGGIILGVFAIGEMIYELTRNLFDAKSIIKLSFILLCVIACYISGRYAYKISEKGVGFKPIILVSVFCYLLAYIAWIFVEVLCAFLFQVW